MSFELHPSAEKDLESVLDFYRKHAGQIIAERFLEEFYRVANFLVANPEIVSPAQNGHRRYPLQVFPYSVVYVTPNNGIRILIVGITAADQVLV